MDYPFLSIHLNDREVTLSQIISGEALAAEMRKLWAQSAGRSGGKRIRRSDAYDPRRS